MKKALTIVGLFLGLSGCGTTYVLPDIDDVSSSRAKSMFAEAQNDKSRKRVSVAQAERRFHRVSRRVEPVAEKFCEAETASLDGFDCDVQLAIDRDAKERNAYFTYRNDKPKIFMTMPILQDMKNDDEVAFVLGHEYGHLVGQHIQKKKQQAMAGALILGALTAYSNAQAASAGVSYDPDAVGRNMELGAAVGSRAYSQTYELESDTLGTRIAKASGYDPVKGAKYFARPEDARTDAGNLSFWGTHPPDEKRLATVLAVSAQIEAQQGLQRKK
ncbi:peptidase M48, Ste24p [Roseovarius sp. A46]|uniref:M48 family metalloprotease n=1 Tax=Roseovarius sp. A46 TaxID=2109331 RepID=UPI0010121C0F|nr:M48 family metalloprotease [Roseovarius sp. A46]RXV61201.1 peptidase M48, Ste24p [Roseovarius sp. A46]